MRFATRTVTESAPPRAQAARPPEGLPLRAGSMVSLPRTTTPTPKAKKTTTLASFDSLFFGASSLR
jgi:hypothetical protein